VGLGDGAETGHNSSKGDLIRHADEERKKIGKDFARENKSESCMSSKSVTAALSRENGNWGLKSVQKPRFGRVAKTEQKYVKRGKRRSVQMGFWKKKTI